MTAINETWSGLAARARLGIVIGVVLIVAAAVAIGVWAYRADYQVLFSDVAPRDAAAMTAELDTMKIPYQLGDGGKTILVPKDMVYKTRLTLMGKDLPLHGAVGFEVFNNADFGMTEFVQKVNYLRAIQGELTRTILSIDGIGAARVHLALPEQGLFKKSLTKPKASVTLTMKQGRTLAPEQIAGIQRLVGASVPEIVAGDVTVLDQHGVALTRVSAGEPGGESASTQLDSKRSTEEYLARKLTQVLDRTFGEGAAVASVDVSLNLDQRKVTTEEVLPAKGGAADAVAAGVVVRERQSSRENGAEAGAAAKAGTGGVSSTEIDYNVGRRTEQLSVASGTVRRMTIAVLVRQPLTEGQLDKLKEVVSLAAGFNAERGDAVVVYPMNQFANASAPMAAPVAAEVQPDSAAAVPGKPRAQDTTVVILVLLGVIGVVAVAAAFLLGRRRHGGSARARLTPAERAQMLSDVRQWIGAPEVTAASREPRL